MNLPRRVYSRLPAGLRSWLRSLLPDAWLRNYAHRNTDVYLISYPKCGRTWLRLMIGRALATAFHLPEDEEILFLRSNRRFHPQAPRILVIHDDRPMLKAADELAVDKSRFGDKKVIFLVRDPRDVIVSSYFEMKNRGRLFGANPYETRQAVFDGTLSEFINRRVGGFDTLLAYYNIWVNNRETPAGFLLVRYEDLKADPRRELRRVLDFLALENIDAETINDAVEYASFENMRKMEVGGNFQDKMLKPANPADANSYKTRKGKVKGYLEYLTPGEIQELDRKLNENLSDYLGYRADVVEYTDNRSELMK